MICLGGMILSSYIISEKQNAFHKVQQVRAGIKNVNMDCSTFQMEFLSGQCGCSIKLFHPDFNFLLWSFDFSQIKGPDKMFSSEDCTQWSSLKWFLLIWFIIIFWSLKWHFYCQFYRLFFLSPLRIFMMYDYLNKLFIFNL